MELPFLQQENARSQTNTKTAAGFRRFGITLLDHPTYRIDLVSSGFHLFCIPKDRLRGRHCASKLWFRRQDVQCYRDELHEVTWSLEKLFGPQSGYVEKKVHKGDQ